ncbi:MAG: response regulator [Chloroflexota bacterium]|nr:response regulator [Chloroflexota bacterium]
MTGRLRIMVVDDESLIVMALHDQLEYLGHQVVATADNGAEAVELAKQLQPDLVLMDVHMGGIDGLDAAALINADRPTPVVILTGFPDKTMMEFARECGVVAYMVKPIDIEDLRQAVESGYEAFRLDRQE